MTPSKANERRSAATDRDFPAYTLAEAARYLRLPVATLRSWALGRAYPTAEGRGQFPPLLRPASRRPPLLSFSNLIEAHMLRSLRTEHGVPVKALRSALAYRSLTGASLLTLLRSGLALRRSEKLTRTQMLMAANAPILIRRAMVEGHPDEGVLPSGEVAGLLRDRPSVKDLVDHIVTEASERLAALEKQGGSSCS